MDICFPHASFHVSQGKDSSNKMFHGTLKFDKSNWSCPTVICMFVKLITRQNCYDVFLY